MVDEGLEVEEVREVTTGSQDVEVHLDFGRHEDEVSILAEEGGAEKRRRVSSARRSMKVSRKKPEWNSLVSPSHLYSIHLQPVMIVDDGDFDRDDVLPRRKD